VAGLSTASVTAAQRSLVEAQVATHPNAKLVPEIAAEIAAAYGWPVAERQLSPGDRLLKLSKG
jgi:hypothetical protein